MRTIERIAQIVLPIVALLTLIAMFALANSCHAQTTRECVVYNFTSQLGVHESTGRNDGPEVKKYLASTHLNEGFAWCAAFVNWNMRQCGAMRAGSAWAPDWFPKAKVIYTNGVTENRPPPQPGDVFGIYFPAKQRIAHVGFILEWKDSSVVTIEGNTNTAGSREGDGVYKKIRLKKQIYKVSNWIDL
jgi:hypothetical protein